MGITIHFEGRLQNVDDLRQLLNEARTYASSKGWPLTEIPLQVRKLDRVKDEEYWDYEGLTSGIEITPHPNSEPLRFEFDENGFLQEYVKTQFAPIDIHIEVVELLRQIERFFEEFEVIDESDFWETKDLNELEQHFKRFFEVVEDEKKKNPKLSGPHRLSNNRIADLLEED
jgi:hypothetical protein